MSVKSSWASPHKGKLKRQLAILDAARQIIVEEGEAGLNMRAVAARANVSLVTPYNLFGSKQAVILAIVEEDLSNFVEHLEDSASPDPLIKLFDLIDMSIEHFDSASGYYRAVLPFLYANLGSQVGQQGLDPQAALVRRLVADAVQTGRLRASTPVELVSASLLRAFRAVVQEWVSDVLTLENARDELGASFGLLLASLVTHDAARDFAEVLARYPAHLTAAPTPAPQSPA